ncbi:MAG: FCD domain-containing protein [Alcaligenaceae bacterium]|nr:FCD domain-containing protein [Alcaligenaceae bacterium]
MCSASAFSTRCRKPPDSRPRQSRNALLQSALDHADIVKALEAHDAELGVRLVQRHINRESE